MSWLSDGLIGGLLNPSGGGPSFYWSSNTPYLRPIWVKVRRAPKGGAAALTSPMIGPDANGAAIIYECMTNTDWGIGTPEADLDFASFDQAAAALAAENFGMSLVWGKETEVEGFIDIVRDHIDADFFVHPRTGKHTLRLVRGDYDPETLRELNPDNCTLESLQRRGFGELTAEMKVTWTNPDTEQEESVSLQNLATMAKQKGMVSASKNYYGVRNADLAMQLCARELRKAGTPVLSAEVKCLREFWDVVPSDVLKLNWPEKGIDGVVMRVADVDYGSSGDPWVTLRMGEDIFSLAQASYTVPPTTSWQDPSEDPTDTTDAELWTLPAFVAAALADAPVTALEYPQVLTGLLAATSNTDAQGFEALKEVTSSTGEPVFELRGSMEYQGHTTLTESLGAEPETLLATIPEASSGYTPVGSTLIVIGEGPDSEREIAMIQAIDQNGYLWKRGVLDTVPRKWPAGTPIWYLHPGGEFMDGAPASDGETATYKFLMNTGRGQYDIDLATEITGTLTARPHLPNRPADVRVEGQGFQEVYLFGQTDATVSWAQRNRINEDAVVLGWQDPDITPEAGQTTVVRALSESGAVLQEFPGLTGTEYQLALSAFGPTEAFGFVEVGSERDGFDSLQAFRVPVRLAPVVARITEESVDPGDLTFRITEDGAYRTLETDFHWPLQIVNPGAETGDLTGWTVVQGDWDVSPGSSEASSYPDPFEGAYYFRGDRASVNVLRQDVPVLASAESAIDAGALEFFLGWQQSGIDSETDEDAGRIDVAFLDGGGAVLATVSSPLVSYRNVWHAQEILESVPSGTRTVRIELYAERNDGLVCNVNYDALRGGFNLVA